jgi:hypothetical protein
MVDDVQVSYIRPGELHQFVDFLLRLLEVDDSGGDLQRVQEALFAVEEFYVADEEVGVFAGEIVVGSHRKGDELVIMLYQNPIPVVEATVGTAVQTIKLIHRENFHIIAS